MPGPQAWNLPWSDQAMIDTNSGQKIRIRLERRSVLFKPGGKCQVFHVKR